MKIQWIHNAEGRLVARFVIEQSQQSRVNDHALTLIQEESETVSSIRPATVADMDDLSLWAA